MKKRILCSSIVLLLSFSLACEGEHFNDKVYDTSLNVTKEVFSTDNKDIDSASAKGTEEISENKDKGFENTAETSEDINSGSVAKNEDSEDTDINEDMMNNEDKSVSDEEIPSLDDYIISDLSGSYVAIKSAIVREGPSMSFEKVGQVEANEVVEVTGETDNGWYKFIYDSGEGFANQKFFEDKESFDKEMEAKTEEDPDEDSEGIEIILPDESEDISLIAE